MNIYAELLDNWCTQFTVYLTSQLARQFYGSPRENPSSRHISYKLRTKACIRIQIYPSVFSTKIWYTIVFVDFFAVEISSGVYEALIVKRSAVRGLKHLREDKVCFYKN